MKTILVFGAGGFIGSHLCSKLKKEKNIKSFYKNLKIDFIKKYPCAT